MSLAPFPNDYALRLVAESDSKSCVVCYKPSSSVLISANSADFFYICPNHLQDDSFATPVHPAEYQELITKKTKLTGDIAQCKHDMEAVRPYTINKLITSIPGLKPKKLEEGVETNLDKFNKLQEQHTDLTKQLAEVGQSITEFKFKKFTLNKDIYRIRINSLIQQKVSQKRQAELNKPGFFPSVPSNQLT